MKEFITKHKIKLLLFFVIIVQSIIFIICGIQKSYIHMDEAYSLGLASYDKVEIQDNEDFYDNWHTKEYYEDYLSIEDDEINDYSMVYENQKNDVHPPLYYLFLRIAMNFTKEHFSKWSGIAINIIIYAFITIFMYLIANKLLKNQKYSKEKSVIIAFTSSITMASLTNVIYIRMYVLSTLNIVIATYLHMKLLDSKDVNYKLLTFIGISALVGSLTHYYYLFYLAMLYLIFVVKYIKEKEYKKLIFYTLTMVVAAGASLTIFPYSIKHMFLGYRGEGVLHNLLNIQGFLMNIGGYILKLNWFNFNNTLYFILVVIFVLLIVKKYCNHKVKEKNEYLKIIYLPTLFYFILVSIASPWIELRYIMPICSLMFLLVFYILYKLFTEVLREKKSNIATIFIIALVLISPIIFKIEPEVMYSDKKEIVSKLENELNIPTLFAFNSNNNRFLDDILLFTKINESYIAKDIVYSAENIKKIFENKDVSNGIVVFINEGQENDEILKSIKEVFNFKNTNYLKRLNACDVYYIN